MAEEEKKVYEVGGYSFSTEKDAELARKEQDRVNYLEKRMNYDRPEVVLAVYNKAIDSRLFSTPIGMDYLQKVRGFLNQHQLLDRARPIPIFQDYSYDPTEKIRKRQATQRVAPSNYSDLKGKLRFSIILNVLLAVAVVAMFAITLTSDNPNILNYKRALENQYATWGQELSDREAVIREKERELNIQWNN